MIVRGPIASGETHLSGVLPVPAWYRNVSQQRVAARDARREGGAHALLRHTERRGVPRTEIRCAILGLGVRTPLL